MLEFRAKEVNNRNERLVQLLQNEEINGLASVRKSSAGGNNTDSRALG